MLSYILLSLNVLVKGSTGNVLINDIDYFFCAAVTSDFMSFMYTETISNLKKLKLRYFQEIRAT